MERVRRERRAAIAPCGAPRDHGAAHVDREHRRDDDERIPLRVHVRVAVADQPQKRAPRDEETHGDEERRLPERGQMLGLAVSVRVAGVGRAAGDTDGEERQQRCDEIGSGVQRLRDESKRARHQPDDELDRQETGRRDDRDERRLALRGHANRMACTNKEARRAGLLRNREPGGAKRRSSRHPARCRP
jgi:hypothetical protein